MAGDRRAEPAGAVGAGRGHRAAGFAHQRLRHRMVRRAYRHRLQPGADQPGNRRVRPSRQHEGQRARPEGFGEAQRRFVELRPRPVRRQVGRVDDQGIEAGPALGFEDARHRPVVGRVGAQAVDGLGREGDEAAGAKLRRRRLNPGPVRQPLRHARRPIPALQAGRPRTTKPALRHPALP